MREPSGAGDGALEGNPRRRERTSTLEYLLGKV